MRRAIALLTAVSALSLAHAACAQSRAGESAGLRYMGWPSRPAAQPAAQPADAPAAQPRDALRRPNMVIPHGGFAQAETARPGLTPAPGPRSVGLTPANAWLRRGGTVQPQPQPQPQPAPPPAAAPTPTQPREAVAYNTPLVSQMEAPRELTPPTYPDHALNRGYRPYVPGEVIMPVTPEGQPVYHGEADRPVPAPSSTAPRLQPQSMAVAPQGQPAIEPEPAPAPPANADPMAPRRDAPIFRMQQARTAQPTPPQPSAAQPAQVREQADANAPRRVALVTPNGADRPTRDMGARFYSVHRQNGQQPDAIALPEPTYVDALAVNLAETPASQDLAAPDRGPTLIRDNQGRLRAAPAASDGDHQ